MKYILILLIVLHSLNSFAQTTDTLKKTPNKASEVVSFIARVNLANAEKDGIHLNGYVVNLDYDKIRKLNGRKIRVTGKVAIVKGVKNEPGKPQKQARESDTKYIDSPKIEIVRD